MEQECYITDGDVLLVALRMEASAVSASVDALFDKTGQAGAAASRRRTGRDAHSCVTVFTFCDVTPRSFVDVYVPTLR